MHDREISCIAAIQLSEIKRKRNEARTIVAATAIMFGVTAVTFQLDALHALVFEGTPDLVESCAFPNRMMIRN
jgi:isoprenylcysteine carboxyl methyltransferase (ICMT) family protein YpbQ